MTMKISRFVLIVVLLVFAMPSPAQDLKFEMVRHKTMLDRLVSEVKRHYFDPEFKGIDIDEKHREAIANIEKATGVGQLRSAIAQFFAEFNDSHMFFLPPGHVNNIEYGIDFRMFGERCVVIYVEKGSDAEKKGLEIGDELRSISGFTPTRDSLWRVRYFFFVLFPQPSLKLDVAKPDGRAATYEIEPKVSTGTRVTQPDPNQIIRDSERNRRLATRQYYYDKFPEAFIWKMPSFSLEPHRVDGIIGRAKKHPALVFDLRGNGGGRVDMLRRLIGNVFSEDVKVGDEVMRRRTKEMIAKTRGRNAYTGTIAVLIDADSGSASEVFSRVIQLEERGLIIGERSAGAVMESRVYGQMVGVDVVAVYGASITIADLIMKDGKSIEHVGVTPDILIVPTPQDIAAKRDIVLARVLEALGVKVTPEEAYKIFEHTLDGRSE
ncbi:MAG TPA: S41 family peptidase [Pyrinomonadaceae bacterium]|nr:S41 family peptidase [Pyrinomonadaceae bacterium]